MCTHTRTCTSTGTLHRVRGLRFQLCRLVGSRTPSSEDYSEVIRPGTGTCPAGQWCCLPCGRSQHRYYYVVQQSSLTVSLTVHMEHELNCPCKCASKRKLKIWNTDLVCTLGLGL